MTDSEAQDLLLEIGTEELPAAFVGPAMEYLSKRLPDAVREARLEHGAAEVYGTPRRLAVLLKDVSCRQPDRSIEHRGPAKSAAFDSDGRPTKAAEGFARGKGVSVDSLMSVDTPKGAYVVAKVDEKGREATEILSELIPSVIASIPFAKSMRWGEVRVHFARPIHWILALLGDRRVPFVFGDVSSGERTFGHRFLAPDPLVLESPDDYLGGLESARVIADADTRRRRIIEQSESALAEYEPSWRLREDQELLDEVTHLVEWPAAVVGAFDVDHLNLPVEVLVSEMRQHQRYFSVTEADTGRLAPAFVAISNTPPRDPVLVREGYERVLAARLADARYFYDTDRARKLEERVDGLGRVVFQEKLGSVLEKVRRVRCLSASMAGMLGLSEIEHSLSRVVTLAKADLTTGMVGEFPDLQGVMGRYYALEDGEQESVARGIEEHYLPRHAGDRLPDSHEGALAGIADRLDTMAGIFGLDKGPTGTADPFGLRRACLAIVSIVLHKGYRLPLSELIEEAARLYGDKLPMDVAATREKVMGFFRGRLKNLWTAKGHSYDVVDAVLSAGFDDLVSARDRVAILDEVKNHPDFSPLAVAFARASNIVAKAPAIQAAEVDPELFESSVEMDLWKALAEIKNSVEQALESHDYRAALSEMAALKEPVDAFFEGVMVMDEDLRRRENRLLLLVSISSLFRRIADFSLLRAAEQ